MGRPGSRSPRTARRDSSSPARTEPSPRGPGGRRRSWSSITPRRARSTRGWRSRRRAPAPAGFGTFSGDLLVGNFGNGRIHAFVPAPAGEFEDHGPLHSTAGRPIEIPGLWALQFGNGAAAGPKTTLFFTAGPFDEQHGPFRAPAVADPPGHNP